MKHMFIYFRDHLFYERRKRIGEVMVGKKQMQDMIEKEFDRLGNGSSNKMDKVSRNLYPYLPEGEEAVELFDHLVDLNNWIIFWLVTQWIKKKELYDLRYIDYYERWLHEYIDKWGKCDIFCYRVLNPMLERHPELFEKVVEWTSSDNTYVRRAAAVSLIRSGKSFSVNFPFEKIIRIVEVLKEDEELHVQKGVGWLLKYTYLSFPDKVNEYLKENVDSLSRVTFRYALEKMPEIEREELMEL